VLNAKAGGATCGEGIKLLESLCLFGSGHLFSALTN